jgi:WD40 repeat protein
MLVLRGHDAPIHALAYAPGDAATLASSSADGTVKLWNPAAGRAWATFRSHRAPRVLAFSPDGALLATGDPDEGGVSLWDVALECHRGSLWLARPSEVTAAVFLPNGAGLLTGSHNRELGASGLLQWFHLPERESVVFRPWPGGIGGLALAPDGRTVAIAGHLRWTIELLNLDVELERRRPAWKFQAPVRSLAFAPDGRALAVAAGRTVELRDVADSTRQAVLKGHRSEVWAVAFSPDGRLLLSGDRDRTVRLWDVASQRQRACFDWHIGRVHAVAFSPDGMTAAAGGERAEVVVWDVDDVHP